MEKPPTRPGSNEARRRADQSRVGTTVANRYRLRDFVARGGQGEVYEGEDLVLERTVAVKLLREGADATARERFRREALYGARLAESAHLVPVLDADPAAAEPYLVMPLYRSQTLGSGADSYLAKYPEGLTYAETKRYIEEIAEGLADAHAQEIWHRDLKPSNILITTPRAAANTNTGGGNTSVRILDFGIGREEDATTVTDTGARVGTPRYMAPEMMLGHDRGSGYGDVYAAGLLAYDMLLGLPRRPKYSEAQLRDRYLGEEPWPELATLAELKAKRVPHAFSDVIAKAVAIRPQDRFQDGGELLRALREVDWRERQNPRANTIVDGRFRLVRELGRGGMASVWEAEDCEQLDAERKRVAVKMVAAGKADKLDKLRQRLLLEKEALLALSGDPNVVRLRAAGTDQGEPYLVLQILEGATLDDWLPRLRWSEFYEVLEIVAAAADRLHQCGVIHRDLKPENINIGLNGQVTLFDFNGAHLQLASELTEAGEVIGTVGLMAPERLPRAETEKGKSFPTSDQYSLGAIVYAYLSGLYPTQRSADSDDVSMLEALAENRIRPIGELRPDAPRAVVAAVGRALDKAPEKRFESCLAFVRELGKDHNLLPADAQGNGGDLHRLLEQQRTTIHIKEAAAPPTQGRPKKARLLLAAAATALGVALGGGGMALWLDGGSKETTPSVAMVRESATSDGGAGAPGADAAAARASSSRLVARLGEEEVAGVKLRVNGQLHLTPAIVEHPQGEQLQVTVEDAKFRRETKVLSSTGDGSDVVIAIREARRKSGTSRRKPVKKGAEEHPADEAPAIYESKVIE